MNPPEGERKRILVVEDRELFTALLHGFSCDYFEVLFAEGPTDALALGKLRNLCLVSVHIDSTAGLDLAGALKEMSGDIIVMGTTARPPKSLGDTPDCVDQVVARSNLEEVTSVAQRQLGERRKLPRVMVDFPVKLRERGIGIVKDLSATSLLVETMSPLDEGEWVKVEIGEGEHPFQFEAQVGRMQRSVLGKGSLVLMISEEISDARDYLEQLVWKLMEVQYYLNGDVSRPGVLRGPMSWDMARRVERNLRESQELRIISANQVDEAPSADMVEGRYRLGRHLGRWGVGEVYSASHLLLKRPVVIKILRQDLKGTETARKRMASEAVVPTKVSGPCIVDIVDFGSDGHEGLFYAMEALTGETLAGAVKRGQEYSARDIARLGLHLATALAIAHLRGYGHFDLCPQNVFLQKWSVGPAWPMLINMGGHPFGGLADSHPMGEDFWPPEAPEGSPGPKHDVYGLGALLEYLCPRTAKGGAAQGFDLLSKGISRATSPETEDRYPDMNVMAHALVQCWEALEEAARDDETSQIESPHDLKKVFEQSASAAKTFSSRFIADAMTAFAAADPRPEDPPAYTEIEVVETPAQPGPEAELAADDDDAESPPEELDAAEAEIAIEEAPAQSGPEDEPVDDEVKVEASPSRAVGETAAVGKPAKVPPARRLPLWAVLLLLGALAIGTGIWLEMASSETPAGGKAVATATVPQGPGPLKKRSVALPPAKPRPEVSGDNDEVLQPIVPDLAVTATTSVDPDARPAAVAVVKQRRPESERGGKLQRLAAIKEARELIKGGKYSEARQRLETALRIQDSPGVRSLLSQTCEKTGQYQQAIDHLKKVAALKPDVAWYQDKLGRLYLKVGKTDLACQAFKRALKILPTYPVSRGNLKKHCKR